MALGGGTFITQNKVLPGTYINFISVNSASPSLSDRGVVTMPLELDWGIEDAIFEVTPESLEKDAVKLLGYESDSTTELLDRNVSPRGYRVLNKIPKMPASVIEKIIDAFGSLQIVCNATAAQLDDVDGIGERRAKIISQSLKRLQEQNILKLYNI